MSELKFRCPRLLDNQVIVALQNIALECKLTSTQLAITGFENGSEFLMGIDAIDASIAKVIALNGSNLLRFSLAVFTTQDRRYPLVVLTRKSAEYFDEVVLYKHADLKTTDLTFMLLVAAAKREFKEIKIEGNLSGFSNKAIDEYYAARDATLTRLETVSRELLIDIHKKQQQIESEICSRTESAKAELERQKQELEKEHQAKLAALAQREAALASRESAFETKESKYLRRDLRKELLAELARRSQAFKLTSGTRHLRLPILLTMATFVVFCAVMIVLNYTQADQVLKTAQNDLSKVNWWQFCLVGVKQLGFVAAFLGGVWYLIRWSDRWFRQHAEAEFKFKQMELDVNRASWVIETALEWRKENKAELPPELLEPLARNLFHNSDDAHESCDTPPDLASMLFGAASTLTIKTPTGAEVNLDRKGLKQLLRKMPE